MIFIFQGDYIYEKLNMVYYSFIAAPPDNQNPG
ncbi:hypothetical protein ING2E5B_0197 [Fermentimonas caenicola]|uniref:Uncharacterized protein n=1 Tax=Fermentimonas caenicola TaxID=1562970 RepID=A0A098BZC3_9BACT|nr:hypothetical protein ING2E5B_0197 [Fermentimonas caenicola]